MAAHLMNLQWSGNQSVLKKALDDWYDQKQKNYETWAGAYPVKQAADMHQPLEVQKDWCKMVEISGTPTLFINGRRLPKNYQPEDLRYFI